MSDRSDSSTVDGDFSTEQDVVDVLMADHAEVAALLAEVFDSTDPHRRRELADQLLAELVRHSVAEEMVVYPAIRDHLPGGKDITAQDAAEHKELEAVMRRLERTDSSDHDFHSVVRQLQRLFSQHVRDEEDQQLPQLRAHLSRKQLVSLAGRVQAAKKVAPTRPHPGAPNAELFHKTVGAGVGLVDRLRDKLSGRAT